MSSTALRVLLQVGTSIAGELVMASYKLKAQKLEVFQWKMWLFLQLDCSISSNNNLKNHPIL